MSSSRGFTLIELMITVAIVAILASVAYPSYLEYVRKSRRADAKSALMHAAQVMERRFSEQAAYPNETKLTALLGGTLNSSEGYYALSLAAGSDDDSYTLEATPRSGTSQAEDKCGTFTLTHEGTKGVDDAATGYDAARCW